MVDDTLFMRRKRARFRSWHRGTREADLLIGSFADEHVDGFDRNQLERFEALLEEVDADLISWISGRAAVPSAHDSDVMRLLRRHTFPPARP